MNRLASRTTWSIVAVVAAAGFLAAQDRSGPGPDRTPASPDEVAIRAQAKAFAQAFEKGDAKAIANMWTARGEYHDPSGQVYRGGEAIGKLYEEAFRNPAKRTLDVLIESIRFPSADVAIEEGLLRHATGKALPTTTMYRVVHAREGGQWKIALAHEWGAGQDRLEDLEWLIGRWHAKAKDVEVTLTFESDRKKPFILGRFVKKLGDRAISGGEMKIGIDPRRAQIRSWHFDDDGGHGQALWIRDGNRWVLDAIGVLAGGGENASVNILSRIAHDEFTWRSIDRVVAGQPLPDTVPLRLRRVEAGK